MMVSKNHSKPVTRTPGPESFRFRSVVVAVQSFSSISCDDDGPCRSSSITIDDLESSPPSKRRDSLLLLHQAASTAELTNHLIHRRSSERKLATSCPPDVSFVYSKRGSDGRLATSVENVNEDEDLNSIDEATEENPEQAVTASSTLPSTLQIQRNAGEYTVIAFVNSASGGGEGKALFKCLQDHLGESFVIDLHSCGPGNMPEDSLLKYARDPMVRLLACGGDGTCGWILSSLDKVWSSICSDGEAKYKDHLPLAIMPLGTGNDLSRQYNWGGAFKLCMKDKSMIKSVEKAKLTYLDTWRCIIMPTHKLEEDEKRLIPHILGSSDHLDDDATSELLLSLLADGMLNESLSSKSSRKKVVSLPTTDVFDGSFCNYFSLGFDATIAYGFHRAREEHPERFKSRLTNQLFYIKESPHALRTPTLRKRIKVLVNNEQGQLVELNVPKRCRAIIIMNIQSYAGGHQLTSTGSPGDGYVEVVFVSNLIRMAASVLSPVMPFLLFQVASKTNKVCLRTRCPLHCQIDGEPWLQGEGVIQIKYHSRKSILENVPEKASCGCMGTGVEDSVTK